MENKEHRLASIMFTDIVGFSKMMEQNEKETIQLVKIHNELIYKLTKQFGGTVIKTIGDAFLVSFSNTTQSVQCAVEIQNELQNINHDINEHPLLLRIGVYVGDIYFFDNDALGEGINIASRLQGLASPGKIIISREVYTLVQHKLGLTIKELGQVELKNISKEINAFEIDPSVKSPEAPKDHVQKISKPTSFLPSFGTEPTASETARRLDPEKEAKVQEKLAEVQSRLRNKAKEMFEDEISQEKGDKSLTVKKDKSMAADMEDESSKPTIGKRKFFARVKDVISRKLERLKLGFRIHLTSFVAVNGLLAFLNLVTSPSTLWFVIPAAAWGMGLLMHYGAYKFVKKKSDEINRFDYLSPEQLHTLEKYLNSKRSFGLHALSSAAVASFCALMNIYSGGPLWFAIVGASLALPVAIHYTVHSTVKSGLRKKLKRLLSGVEARALEKNVYEGSPEYIEAMKVRDSILKQISNSSTSEKSVLSEITPILDQYTDAIKILSKQLKKYKLLLKAYEIENIKSEQGRMQSRLETVSSSDLKEEYSKALTHIDKQLASYQQLEEREELVQMRIKTSINSMKKLQMDFAMLEDVTIPMQTLRDARSKVEELQNYAEDLEEGYRILDSEI